MRNPSDYNYRYMEALLNGNAFIQRKQDRYTFIAVSITLGFYSYSFLPHSLLFTSFFPLSLPSFLLVCGFLFLDLAMASLGYRCDYRARVCVEICMHACFLLTVP